MIHIGGPLGAGKTTLAEAAIAHASEDVMIAARCQCDDSLTEPSESCSTTDPELRRYPAAGAGAATRYSFPDVGDVHDAFFMTGLMKHYSVSKTSQYRDGGCGTARVLKRRRVASRAVETCAANRGGAFSCSSNRATSAGRGRSNGGPQSVNA